MSGDCILCGERDRYVLDGEAKRTEWGLVREDNGTWSLEVLIENTKLGVAMCERVPVDHCPECGKEL